MLILQPGHSWVTDLGRFAGARKGLSINGALDQYAAQVANLLVGNRLDAPLIELLQTGLTFLAEEQLLCALTGADAEISIDGQIMPGWMPLSVRPGQSVTISSVRRGLRCYLAVHGGFDVPRLLGSCAPDSMIGFGTRLTAGMSLSGITETPELHHPHFELPLMRLPISLPNYPDIPIIPVTDGPDYDEFGKTSDLLYNEVFTVSPRSNHVGLRLSGHRIPTRNSTAEILSRGVPVGAVEVPSTEGLLVLHRGRGVTAGYPVLAVVTAIGLDQLAQVPPGQQIRFRRISVAEARDSFLDQHHRLIHIQEIVRDLLIIHGVPLDQSEQKTSLSTTPAHNFAPN